MENVFEYLENLGVSYELFEHVAVFSVHDAQEAYTGKSFAENKNLFLRNRKGDTHYLVTVPASKKVDLDVLAIAIEHRAIVVSDDHRIQNVAGLHGVGWHPVLNEGIKEHWEWVLECKGCKKLHAPPENVSRFRRTYGTCDDCGSKLKLKRGGS